MQDTYKIGKICSNTGALVALIAGNLWVSFINVKWFDQSK